MYYLKELNLVLLIWLINILHEVNNMNKTIKLLLVALGLTVAQANTTIIVTPQPTTVMVTPHDVEVAHAMGVVLVAGAIIHASTLHHYHSMHRHHRKHPRNHYKSGRRMRIQKG